MKQLKSLLIATAVVSASLLGAGTARAALVAGWDFSQYFGANINSIDGATFVKSLDANYSSLDPSNGLGVQSAAFGTLYYDGQFGSSNVAVGPGIQSGFAPAAANPGGSLSGNLNAPVDEGGLNPFDSHTLLDDEGQTYTNLLGMTASQIVSVVFEADLSSVPLFGSNWELSFGALSLAGTSTIGVSWSTNGSSYTSAGNIGVTSDAKYSVNLGAIGNQKKMYVRLDLNPSGGAQPIIDNVALNASLSEVPVFGGSSLLEFAFLALLGIAAIAPRSSRVLPPRRA